MKRLTKFIAALTMLAFVFNATRVSAATLYESPALDGEIDMVFSVAKGDTVDRTENGANYDGRPYGDYWQIHENINKTGNNGRYSVVVSGAAIAAGIQHYMGDGDIRNVNEDYLDTRDVVEKIIREYAGIDFDYACGLAAKYIAAHRTDIELEGYKELWDIDFYVMKLQKDSAASRIHVDGRVIAIEIEEPVITDIPVADEPVEDEPLISDAPTEPTPEITEIPEITDVPEVTETPEVTEVPEITDVPEVTEVPEVTDVPEVTEIPEVTETPEVTDAPAPIKPIVVEVPITVILPTPTPDLAPTPTTTPTPTPIEEEIDVNVVETPEGTPEEIEVEVPETPEGAPEEEVEVELPDVPEGLPQTGVMDSEVFIGFGLLMIVLGAIMIRKRYVLL